MEKENGPEGALGLPSTDLDFFKTVIGGRRSRLGGGFGPGRKGDG